MAMDLKEIEKYIKEAMPDASIEIQDLAGDGIITLQQSLPHILLAKVE